MGLPTMMDMVGFKGKGRIVRQGICKLCLQTRELQDSHFIPSAMYKYLRDPSEKNPNPVVVDRKAGATTSKQVKDFLLCAKCEDIFNRNGEKEMLKWVWNGKSFPLGDRLSVALSLSPYTICDTAAFSGTAIGIDTEKFAYFALSVIWRAAVHQWNTPFGGETNLIILNAFEEPIRKYLLGTAGFPADVVVIATVCTDLLSIRGFYIPSQVSEIPGICFAMLMLGVNFRVFIGRDMPPKRRDICCVNSAARLIFRRDCSQKTVEAFDQITISSEQTH